MDDSNFTENTQGQSSFIILPSQEESQQESQPDKQMMKIIKNLPALQNPDKAKNFSSDTCTDEEHEKRKVSVLVSDTDSVAKTDVNVGPSDCVSDSDSDAEVTVIQKKLSGERTEGKSQNQGSGDGNSPGNTSSFQSRNRSNLGSYDQCEVYKTQQGHAKGDRFDLFPASQDMFAETGDQDSPSTPSEHLGSLQFSQKPMLVPETIEETLNEIPPSPGVYGSTPIMIPSSPTQETGNQSFYSEKGDQNKEGAGSQHKESSDEGSQTVFDINAAETLASQPQVDTFLEAARESSERDFETSQGKGPDLQDELRLDENVSGSVQINFSQDTLNDQDKESSRKVNKVRSVRQERGGLRLLLSSQKLQAQENSNSEQEVIVIPSGSASLNSQKEVEESDNFMLHLTQSEMGTTQGQRSQGIECNKSGLQDKGERERSQSSRSRHQSSGSGSGSRSRHQSSGSGSGSQNKKKSSRQKHIEHLNDNPLIEWKNESDAERKQEMSVKSSNRFSDEFHLAVPGEMSAKESVDFTVTDKLTVVTDIEKSPSQMKASNTQPQAAQKMEKFEDSVRLVPSSAADLESDKLEPDKLSIGMIQSQSEQTEPVFKLQKPEIDVVNILDESEDVFPKRTGKPKGHKRYILEDSDDEFCANPNTGDTEKLATTAESNTGMDKEEILVATKLDLGDDGNEETQSYQANISIQTDVNGNDKQEHISTHDVAPAESVQNQGTTRMRRLTESSTQTADSKVDNFDNVDINVVQKVADYLQSGLNSRSRSSSTCTDLSDLHGDGSEKGENVMKTPQRKDRIDKLKTPTSLSRRESADQRSPKSPSEIQSIIRTYSDILKKQKQKPKKDDKMLPTSQKPNPAATEETGKVKLVPRRLSSQSLPEELIRAKQGTKTPTSSAFDPWMTARKPQSQLSVESETRSDKLSEISSQKKDNTSHSETGVTQDLSKSFKPHREIDNVSHHSEPIVISQDSNLIMETELEPLEKLEKKMNRFDTAEESSSFKIVDDKINEQPSDGREVSSLEMVHLTPKTNKKGVTHNSPPFLTLERVDSPKKITEIPKELHVDIPIGTENENFLHNDDINVLTKGKQNILSLKPKETLIIKGAENENCDSNETAEMRKRAKKLDLNPSPTVASLRRGDTDVLREKNESRKPYYARSSRNKKKIKRRLSVEKRNISRRINTSLSPTLSSGGSPPVVSSRVSQPVSDSFVASTQKFSPNGKDDIYGFHGTDSQMSPEKELKQASTPGKTPVSTRKRSRTRHKKSGLKKARHEKDDTETVSENKHHVTFETSHRMSSQSSDTTVTTIGSLPSIPSSISQSSPMRDTMVSPSGSSSSRQSVSEGTTTRLAGKRMSIDQALPDTLPLTHSEEDNYQKVTVVIEKVERVYREITTTRKVLSSQGEVLENTQEVKRLDPVIVEENTHKKIQYVYIPSPSRSVTSMTSGDLADVSSSLSRSSVSSSSLGSKIGSLSSSLESRIPGGGKHLETQTSLDQSQVNQIHLEAKSSESSDAVSEKAHTIEVMAAPSSVPRPRFNRSISADKSVDIKPGSAGKNKRHHSLNSSNQSELAGIQHHTPDIENAGYKTRQQTPGPSHVTENQPKLQTPVTHSDQEVSDVQTPLGSTINKTSSYIHSRTCSVESPKTSDSLFSTSSDDNKKSTSNLDKSRSQKKTSEDSSTDNSTKQNRSSDQISPEIPDQEQLVSSSSTPEESVAMVTSDGKIGSRVMAKWKDGFFYPGNMKSSADRYTKHVIHFDDGSKLSVKAADILLIERLPLGQSVMVSTDDDDFVSGLVTKIEGDIYIVETDEGTSGRYTFGQVILSGDQAACIISDHGSDVLMQLQAPTGLPANVGDVSLENLIDSPRRSAKKGTATEVKVEDEGQGQSSSRNRKRKLDALQPQATSTPTPKGKAESTISKRRKFLSDSPVSGIQSSPVTIGKSFRKTRLGLFGKDLGPIPTKKIFRNIHFLLTNVDKTKEQFDEEKKLIQNTSLDTSTDESAAEDEASVPFDKEHLKRQIEAGGGVVLESLDENLISKGKRKVILLSSTYQRTIKYLQCLACGISCLSHMWVIDSSTQDQLLDDKSYVLPAGISLEKRKVMEWRKKNNVFQGIKAVVFSKNNKFVESWTQILSLSKCHVTHVQKQVQFSDTHVIVTDNSCTTAVQRAADKASIPLVGTEWVIQCLVNGRLMSYTGHSRYSHDCLV